MSALGRAKAHIVRDFLKLKHEIPSHDTFSTVFRMIDPKALDAAFGQIFADVEALMADGDVVAIDGKSLRGARGKGQSVNARMIPQYSPAGACAAGVSASFGLVHG